LANAYFWWGKERRKNDQKSPLSSNRCRNSQSCLYPLVENNIKIIAPISDTILIECNEEEADEIKEVYPDAKVIDRTTVNAWEDSSIIAHINKYEKGKIVMVRLWASVCVVGPALSAIDQGFEVYVVANACGDITDETHERTMERMIQCGIRPMRSMQYLLEL